MDILKRLFSQNPANILGIDIGSGTVKVVEVAGKKSRPVLNNFGILELAKDDALFNANDADILKLANQLANFLATGFTARHAVAAIGGQAVFAREITFPDMTDAELRETIKWELDKYVPYAANTYYYDFAVIGRTNTEKEVAVLLVAALRSVVDSMVTFIKYAGLTPLAIEIEPLALYRTLTSADNSLVLDIGKYMTQIIVFHNNSPAVTRNLSLGGERFTEIISSLLKLDYAEANRLKHQSNNFLQNVLNQNEPSSLHTQMQLLVEEIAREVRRTMDYYQMQNPDVVIEKVFLTGGGAKLENLTVSLSSQLDMPVVIHNPLTIVDVPSSFDLHSLENQAQRLSVAIGLALYGRNII